MRLPLCLLAAALLAPLPTPASTTATPSGSAPAGPAFYDEQADGERQLAAAIAEAKRLDKRVLAVFGANWCEWCRYLHHALTGDPEIARELAAHFVVAWIDVNRRTPPPRNSTLYERFVVPAGRRIPALAVLDANGETLLATRARILRDETASEHAGYDREKIRDFIETWRAPLK